MIMNYKEAVHYICFLFSCHYVNWFILFLVRIKYGHAQISVPKLVYQC